MDKKSVVIIGGYGTFGRLIADQLVDYAEIKIAGRNQKTGEAFAQSIGAAFVFCDSNDSESLQKAISGAHLVINATGPFYASDYRIPETCIKHRCHYIDLADGRDFVAGFSQFDSIAKEKKVFACTGASTTPAVTYALASELMKNTDGLKSIYTHLSVGNKNKPGLATLESILSYAGTPIKVWNHSRWQEMSGWSQPEYFIFPAPVGKRRVQLCNVPDLDVFPKLFDAEKIMFKAGVELDIFNISLSFFSIFKKLLPFLRLQALGKVLLWLSGFFQPWGTYAGGVTVIFEDKNGIQKSASFVTAKNGRRIPSSPAVLLARKILREGAPDVGAFPCVKYINIQEFKDFLEPFGIEYKTS